MAEKKILIVNDDELILNDLKEKLNFVDSKLKILCATNYKDGVKYILENKNTIDVAIIDFNLPDVKEGEMVEFTLKKEIPTLVLIGQYNEILKTKLINYDVIDYVQKDSKDSMGLVVKSTLKVFENYNTNVLIVDDSNVQLNILKAILESIKLNVYTATNANDALEIISKEENKISLLLTDYVMPEMDGLELIEIIREKFDSNELGIIALSSNNELNISTKFIKMGANDYIDKPYQKVVVITRVKSILHNLYLFKEAKNRENKIKRYVKLIDENVITSSTDTNGIITDVSNAFCKISGYTKDELIGKDHSIVRHEDMPKELYEDLWNTIRENKTWSGEVKNRKKDGGFYWVKATISPIFNDENEKIGYTAIREDISDKKLIEEISITDGLTGIYNRRHFNELFPKIINSAKRNSELVGFIIMDIDHFKQYNDTYGHQMGDDVLIKVANCIKESSHRADDYCFRLGGEEFGVLFKVETKEKAFTFAEIIRKNIENLKIEHSKNSASSYITVSMGVICKNSQDINKHDEIYKQGDELLYKSKENGRNRVSINR